MISIMTNEGALEIGRALSGGSRFLVWEAALLSENFDGMTAEAVAEINMLPIGSTARGHSP